MNQPGERTSHSRRGSDFLKRYGVVTLGLFLAGGIGAPGCGIGTDPSILAGPDSATPVARDAAPPAPGTDGSSTLPGGIPPIDRVTYETTAVATFALG